MTTTIGQIIDENSSRTLAPAAVASQVALMLVVSVGRLRTALWSVTKHLLDRNYRGIQYPATQEQGI